MLVRMWKPDPRSELQGITIKEGAKALKTANCVFHFLRCPSMGKKSQTVMLYIFHNSQTTLYAAVGRCRFFRAYFTIKVMIKVTTNLPFIF